MYYSLWNKRKASVAAAAAVLLLAATAAPAKGPNAGKCKDTISKATAAFEQAKLKALAKCEAAKRKGKLDAGQDCHAEAKAAAKITGAQTKLSDAIGKACAGVSLVQAGFGGTGNAGDPVLGRACSSGDRPGEPCVRETECPGQCVGGSKEGESCTFNSSCGNRRCVNAKCVGGSQNGTVCNSLSLKSACEAGGGVCNYLEECDGGSAGALGTCAGGTNPGATCAAQSDCLGGGTCDAGCGTNNLLDCVAGLCEGGLCITAKDCGLCFGGPNVNQSCAADGDCGKLCTGGSNPGTPCKVAGDCLGGGTCATVTGACHTGTCSGGFCTAGSGAHGRPSTGFCSPVDRCPNFENNKLVGAKTCDGGTNNGKPCTVAGDCPSGACNPGCSFDLSADPNSVLPTSAVTSCLNCIGEASVDQVDRTLYGSLNPRIAACVGGGNDKKPCNLATASSDCPGGKCKIGDKDLEKCKATVGSAAAKFFAAKRKALQKCESGVLKGNPGPCPDAATQTKITAAAQKLHDAIGKACGGADKAFGGPDDILPQDISTLTNCPNVTPPGAAASCAGATGRGPINTLQDLADCITCLTEFKVDCTDSIAAPGVAGALSSSCNPLCGNSKIDGSCSNDSTRLCGSTLDCVSPGTCVPFENCDDGNSATGDNCPGNCFIKTCSPTAPQHVLTVNVNAPAGATVGGLSIYIEYPDGVVSAPGTGAAVLARINDPAGVVTNANDLDYAINAILLGSPTIPLAPTEAFDITFDSCQSAPAPTLGQFRCVVVSSGDPNGVGLSGVTCSLTLS